MRTICPKAMIVITPSNPDGTVGVHSMMLNREKGIAYDADAAGDSIYGMEEALLDNEHRYWNVWNPEEQTFETYEQMEDFTPYLTQVDGAFAYRNEPSFCQGGSAIWSLTQTFYWY